MKMLAEGVAIFGEPLELRAMKGEAVTRASGATDPQRHQLLPFDRW